MSSEPEGPLTPGPLPDFEALAANTARLMEELGHATAASIKPIEEGRAKPGMSDEVSDIVKTLGQVVEQIGELLVPLLLGRLQLLCVKLLSTLVRMNLLEHLSVRSQQLLRGGLPVEREKKRVAAREGQQHGN